MAIQSVIDAARAELDLAIEAASAAGDEKKARELRARRAYIDSLDADAPVAGVCRVFVSYDDAQKKYFDTLVAELKAANLVVRTGFDEDAGAERVTDTVLASLKACSVYVGILTPDLRTKRALRASVPSPWTIVEQGMAIALGKRYVMMVHRNVDREFCVDGGRQLIPFNDHELAVAVKRVRNRVVRICDDLTGSDR